MDRIKVLIAILILLISTAAFACRPSEILAMMSLKALQQDNRNTVYNAVDSEEAEIQAYIKAAKELRYTVKENEKDSLLYNPRIFKLTLKDFEPPTILKKAGFYKKEGDDEKLNYRNAVIRFQSSINEAITGELTELDNQIIENMIVEKLLQNKQDTQLASSDIINIPPTDSFWITINKSTRILTLYEGQKTIKKYPVAPGKKPSYTPEGKFSIVVMVKNPAWGGGGYTSPVKGGSPSNPLGYRWLGLSPKGGSVYGIHGNNSPYSIGTNASHGCVRMINSDVEELFDIIPNNTPVWIGTAEVLNEWGVYQELCHI